MKRIVAFLLILACCVSLFGCGGGDSSKPTQATEPTASEMPSQPPHTAHTFGDWTVKTSPSCLNEGRAERRCTGCNVAESRTLPKSDHKFNAQNLCTKCYQVNFDDETALVELGVVCDNWYGSGSKANHAWDIKVWNGKVYRAAGDYDKNSGATTILAYDIANRRWVKTGTAADEAIHGFEVIGGTLMAPGIDATDGWSYGNYYVLQEDGKWKQVRNLPNGVHCFDMIECDSKIFAGLGTETVGKTVAVSEDGGKTFKFAPLYKDGYTYTVSGAKSSRTYEFVKHNGNVYALIWFQAGFGGMYEVFRYEDGKMHYVAEGYKLTGGMGVSRKYFGGEFEFGGACYIAADTLNVITDFSDTASWKTVSMPNKERVSDAILRDGVIYVLSSKQDSKTKLYHTVIYKSTTGAQDSFEEVLSYDYGGFPLSFDYDGAHFYIGTGYNATDKSKTGMVLRATPEK